MRIVATSDWHGNLPDAIPAGDVLVIAGDSLTLDHRLEAQREHLRDQLAPYLAALPHERILLVAGNHDFLFASSEPWRDELPDKVSYLLDEALNIGGIGFWGAPWSTFLPGWVYMEPEAKLERRWEAIPPDTDVLIVHGPPFGALDKTDPLAGGAHVGSPSLREWVVRHRPRLVISGHIHEAFGVDRIGSTEAYNVSYLDAGYEHTPDRGPIVIDVAR